jgi:hypothetical protein
VLDAFDLRTTILATYAYSLALLIPNGAQTVTHLWLDFTGAVPGSLPHFRGSALIGNIAFAQRPWPP